MAKRQLVMCCDGTWNDPASSTNIWLTYTAICDQLARLPDDNGNWDEKIGLDRRVARRQGADGATVIAYYDSGVGTTAGRKLTGGSLGLGLSENVRQAYEFLVRYFAQPIAAYEEDKNVRAVGEPPAANDEIEIYGFGFSRGGHTARSLCGFIKTVGGLLAPSQLGAIDDAYRLYRMRPEERPGTLLRQQIDALQAQPVTIKCLGVYDTVGALGVPIPAFKFFDWLFPNVARFHDTMLGNIVENAFQALAIDERRGPFVPALWTAAPGSWQCGNGTAARRGTQRALQVWFAGAHCDVGGGYQDRALADISFGWMMRRAIESGLELPDSAVPAQESLNPTAERHDSFRNWRVLHKAQGKQANVLSDDVGNLLSIIPFGSVVNFGRTLGPILRALRLSPAARIVGGEQPDKDSDRIGFCVNEYVHESVGVRCKRGYDSPILQPVQAKACPVFVERLSPRRPVGKTASLDGAPVQLVDLSAGGAQIVINGPAPEIRKVVVLKLPSDGMPRVYSAFAGDVRATVRWNKGTRVGLAFAA